MKIQFNIMYALKVSISKITRFENTIFSYANSVVSCDTLHDFLPQKIILRQKFVLLFDSNLKISIKYRKKLLNKIFFLNAAHKLQVHLQLAKLIFIHVITI